MQYDENAEKYGYEGEMTPLKCDELKAYKGDVYIPVYGSVADADVYLKKDVDAAIAELKEFAEDACIERDDNQTAIDELQAENAELKQKLEDVQASMYCDVVDANMEVRRMKRALWLARAERASDKARIFYFSNLDLRLDIDGYSYDPKKKKTCTKLAARIWRIIWLKVERKCRAKAEEYK